MAPTSLELCPLCGKSVTVERVTVVQGDDRVKRVTHADGFSTCPLTTDHYDD